ncbi:radical SAM protein [Bradyrhizobium oligotrophicum]|uniref:radical SAM protein n=1 Tax=Bradyrhizobium oligotrophicum TaxID=44255 RepID=UPI003EBF6B25
MGAEIDCILIGYNDTDLNWIDDELKPLQNFSGAYRHFRGNAVFTRGRWRHFTDLLNCALEDATGRRQGLHVARTPSLACCILKSFLAARGLRSEIVNFFNHDRGRLIELLAQSPRTVAITTTVYTTPRPVREVVEFIRQHNPDVRIVVGGPHIFNTCSDHDAETQDVLFQEMDADIYVFDSQGEQTLAELLTELRRPDPDLARVPNLIWTEDGFTFSRSERRPENNDLDANVIDWTVFDDNYLSPFVWMRTARSCAFACAFCRYPAIGGALTLNDIEVLRQQFRMLKSRGVKFIYFIDDTFNVPLPRFKKLCRMMIEENFGFQWASYFRCANADEETFDLIKAAGCVAVFAGIESGDQQVLKNMNKAVKVDGYKRGMRALAERDIMVHASFIIGFPGETAASVQNTLSFIEETAPTFYAVESYFHDPKVPVQDRAAEFNLQGSGYSWSHNTMNWLEAAEHVDHLYRNVKNSALLPLYGVDMWSVPYFLANGITRPQLIEFLRIAQAMVIRSFDEERPNYDREWAQLRGVFQPVGALPVTSQPVNARVA